MKSRTANPLLTKLDQWTHIGTFFDSSEDQGVQCFACAHQCRLKPGQRGLCQVRMNENGVLKVPWGYTTGLALEPIEKKPFNHFLPGTLTLSFGMLGCNFTCDFCQNWVSAQALNDQDSTISLRYLQEITPKEIIDAALKNRVSAIVSTYNEPWITADWSEAIFSLAHENGIKTAFVSNGFATRKDLDKMKPHLDALKVDLKAGTKQNYKQLGGRLEDVLDTIAYAQEIGIWVEVVTLVIPDWNDSPDELWFCARTIAGISPNIPWHVTAFHPDYKMQDRPRTSAPGLRTAAEIGQEAGLNYVYAGNLPGRVGSLEDTYCPACHQAVIKRRGFNVIQNHISPSGDCLSCGNAIPGVWQAKKSEYPHFTM